MVVIVGESAPLLNGPSRRVNKNAVILVSSALLIAAAIIAVVALSGDEFGMDNSSISLLKPFEAPPPYKWTKAGEKANDDEIKKSNDMWKVEKYKWGKAGEKANDDEIKKSADIWKVEKYKWGKLGEKAAMDELTKYAADFKPSKE